MAVKRTNLQITHKVLEITKDAGQPGLKTLQIITKANISHPRFKTLISNLTKSELINKIDYDGKNTFVITEKGKHYLEDYKRFATIAEAFGFEL